MTTPPAASLFGWDAADLLLSVRVRSGHDRFEAVTHDAVRMRITAPPVDGEANRHLIAWTAGEFGVPRSAIRIESGEKGPRKRIRIHAPAGVPDALAPLLDKGLTEGDIPPPGVPDYLPQPGGGNYPGIAESIISGSHDLTTCRGDKPCKRHSYSWA